MKAVSITFERLMNTGNFTHQKIGITLQVEEGEKASDVLRLAKHSKLVFNHEVREYCCNTWYDRRVDDCCPECGKKPS